MVSVRNNSILVLIPPYPTLNIKETIHAEPRNRIIDWRAKISRLNTIIDPHPLREPFEMIFPFPSIVNNL